MPKRHYEVDSRVLAVFFLVAVPFLANADDPMAVDHPSRDTTQVLAERSGTADLCAG